MLCLNCGNLIEEGDLFCGSCGQRVGAKNYTTCANCGQMMEEGDMFCEYCGCKVGAVQMTPPPQQQYSQPQYSPQPPPPASQDAYAQFVPPQPQPSSAPQYTTPQSVPLPRMLLILLLDTSITTTNCISQLSSGLNRFISTLSKDSKALGAVDMAVIQYSESFSMIDDYSSLGSAGLAQAQSDGNAMYSAPIREALRMVEEYSRNNTHMYKPWVVMITTGEPTDDISTVAGELQNMQRLDKLRFIAVGALGYNTNVLNSLTDVVIKQKGTDFTDFFDWLCNCVGTIVRTAPGEKPQLPNLEGDVYRDR